MARVPIRHRGEIYFYFDQSEDWMNEGWKRFMEEDIARAWAWRHWGIDPPPGCTHAMSWQMALLGMMPLVYALFESIAQLVLCYL